MIIELFYVLLNLIICIISHIGNCCFTLPLYYVHLHICLDTGHRHTWICLYFHYMHTMRFECDSHVSMVSKYTGLHISTSSCREKRSPKEHGCELFSSRSSSLFSTVIYILYICVCELTSNLQCIIAAKVSYLTRCGQRRDK